MIEFANMSDILPIRDKPARSFGDKISLIQHVAKHEGALYGLKF